MTRKPPSPRKLPTEASLHAAALAHLGRYAATEQSLLRMLDRRIDRWARDAEHEAGGDRGAQVAQASAQARATARAVVARLAASGAVSDLTFAQGRTRSLARAGRSRLAIAAHLASRGVGQDLIAATRPDDASHELAAAIIHARKRRLGPFRKTDGSPEQRRRDYGSFARAGFDQATTRAALGLTQSEALEIIARFRAGVG